MERERVIKKKCKLSKIDFERHKTELFSEAKKSKIIVCSYLSTTFLELMSANVPVILFTPFSVKGYNTETIKAFYQMEKIKFISETIKKQQHLLTKIGKT